MTARVVVAAALLFSSTQLAAQSVELRLQDAAAGKPVGGAIVRLIGARGPVAQGLTDEAGRLVLRAPVAGSYRIRIDRIGWLGLTTAAFSLDSGRVVRMNVPMPAERTRLPTLEVRSKSRCDSKTSRGELATALWDEVRKALTANAITEAQGLVPLHLREFEREVELGGSPVREWVVLSRIVRRPPFASLAPSALYTTGFVYQAGNDAVFAGPDAALMLSDQFVATHCLYAREGDGALIGLGFQPVSGRRVPDVSGTLWVDRQSSELRFLEFSYTGLPGALRRKELGGRVEFTRLPSGRWIISYWYIRMPRVQTETFEVRRQAREITQIKAYTDRGGRVEVAGDTLGLVHRAILRGQVHDSTTGKGISGALVWVRGFTDSMPTDSAGRFEMAIDAAGDQTVSVRHPRLGLLGEPTARNALLSLGDSTRVDFAVPPIARFVQSLCKNRNRPGKVSLVGLATMADGSPAVNREIRATKRTSRGARTEIALSSSTQSGLYGLCNLPSPDTLEVRLMDSRTTFVEVPVPILGQSRWVDLREWGSTDTATAGFVDLVARTAPVSASPDSLEPAMITGLVYDSTTRQGIPGAVVRVHSQPDSVVTDALGRFTLPSAAPGWQILTITHQGLGELRGVTSRNVMLSPGDSITADFPVIPLRGFVTRMCGTTGKHSGVVGIATGSSGQAESGLLLRVAWIANGRREVSTRSGDGGLFAFCDLPADLPGGSVLTLQVLESTRLIGEVSLQLSRSEFRWVDAGAPPR